jgi:predicted NAD-dependent protein-ADP-ribosyltransferase YbiA (DUF1768 family)
VIDGEVYKSFDHYYQKMKVKDLMGVESEKFTDASTKNFSSLAKEILKSANISRKSIDNWRVTCGVEIIQKALLERVRQSEALRKALIHTGNKIIAHTYAGDDFFGTGCPIKYVKDWCGGMEKNKVSLKFPMTFPLTPETVKNVPVFAKGRNVLGVIYMLLREKINNNALDGVVVELSDANKLVEVEIAPPRQQPIEKEAVPEPTATSTSDVTMMKEADIDFTMDYEVDNAFSKTTPKPKSLTKDAEDNSEAAKVWNF